MNYTERSIESLDWVTLVLIGSLVILAVARYLFPRRFEEFIVLPITNKYFLVQGKDNEIRHPFNLLLFAVQVISISLFIFLFFQIRDEDLTQTNPWLFLQICTVYVVFVTVKYLIEKIVAVVFSLETLINSYLYQKLSYRNVISLLILAVNAVFYYIIKPSITVLIIYLAILLLLNCIALFSSYKSNRNILLKHFFYFILYLCALEISPYIILYKVLM